MMKLSLLLLNEFLVVYWETKYLTLQSSILSSAHEIVRVEIVKQNELLLLDLYFFMLGVPYWQ